MLFAERLKLLFSTQLNQVIWKKNQSFKIFDKTSAQYVFPRQDAQSEEKRKAAFFHSIVSEYVQSLQTDALERDALTRQTAVADREL